MWKKITLVIFLIISCSLDASPIDDGVLYYKSQDYVKAFPILTQLANAGNLKAQGFLSRMYFGGLGVAINYKEAYLWASKGALKDDITSERILGKLYESGYGVPKIDTNEAIKWFKKAIGHGDLKSIKILAQIFIEEKKINDAIKLYESIVIASESTIQQPDDDTELYSNRKGNAEGLLGLIYQYDYIDLDKSLFWFKKGTEDLDLQSYIGLASLYYEQRKYKEAIQLYQKMIDDDGKTLKKGDLSEEFYKDIKGYAAWHISNVYNDFKDYPDHIELSKNWDEKAIGYGYDKDQRIGAEKKAADLIDDGWRYFLGEGNKVVNEPFAQYFTEEGLRIALRIKDKYLISAARNNLGVILGASVNNNIRNLRLSNIHLYDAFENEYAPSNLLWLYYEGNISLTDKEVNELRKRYFLEYNKQHQIYSIEPIPVNIKGNVTETLKFLIKQFNLKKTYELAEQIADYIEDNNDKLELRNALIWLQKAAKLKNVSYKDDVRYKRIEKILAGKYIKDMPEFPGVTNLPSMTNTVHENTSTGKKLKLFALVIGNSKYKDRPLDNAINDSDAITNKLKNIGFEVTEINDLSRKQFNKSIIEFTEKSKDSDVTLMFYSGHGIQLGGVNYLLPVDIDFNESEEIVTYEGISLNDLLSRSLIGKTRVVFIDACRTNPFKTSQSRGFSEGLAPINAPRGTLISYATRDGGVAYDGSGKKNSPYTQALVKHLDDDLDVALMLRSVREEVLVETKDKQEPWEYGSLSGGQLILSKLAK